jgi:hypothetical protein
MELAQALIQLWERKIWLLVGLIAAGVAGFGVHQAAKSSVYAAATTQMVVDAPRSALGDIQSSLEPFTARAGVFALLMTSPQALNAIGDAAGIPGNRIAAEGPPQANLPQVGSSPTPINTPYKLQLNQDPTLPTVDIYAQAPTAQEAVKLANGAVTGFATYLKSLQVQGSVPTGQRVEIRQLGSAIGGVVNSAASTKMAGIVGIVVLLLWCGGILFFAKLRTAWVGRSSGGPADDASPAPMQENVAGRWRDGQPSADADLEAVWAYADPALTNGRSNPGHVAPLAESPSARDES